MKPGHDDRAVMRLNTETAKESIEQLSERELNKRMRSLVGIRIQLAETRHTRMSPRIRMMFLVVLVTLVAALLSPYREYILALGVMAVCLCTLLPASREEQFFSWLARYPVFNQPRLKALRDAVLSSGGEPWPAVDGWIAAEIDDVTARICHLKMARGFSQKCQKVDEHD
ncbi:hypothetical protein [Pantoea sp. BAV 3049]|uniref:hypothetical protein n=1 Tax=Pantoea sp. BAV 3049 TaxID=2654188 RepID=UPI00131BDDA0|nr:hypothetical protein [Pantoea sp. BAV 3049]